MAEYLIYFNQQWVGRGPLAMAVLDGPAPRPRSSWAASPWWDVVDDEAARMRAGRIAEACGWPQEVRRFTPMPDTR